MKAMLLGRLTKSEEIATALDFAEVPEPQLQDQEILLRVSRCGVCHTELDEIEGRTPPPLLPVIPGHQVIGRVLKKGKGASFFSEGDRAGVAWIFWTCGKCKFCLAGNENLCPYYQATGRDANGGYAEYMKIREDFAYRIPDVFSDSEAAPLLCAGAIGYRSLKLAGMKNEKSLGLTGFGASAHLVLKIAKHKFPNSPIFVFARSEKARSFAKQLGADWSGDTTDRSPQKIDCIIDTTPVWRPVLEALENLEPGGRLVINAIRKEDINRNVLAQLNYPVHLWLEKEIKSVANVTRADVREFLHLAAEIPIHPEVQEYRLQDANQALAEIKQGSSRGAKVLRIEPELLP